MKTSSIEVDDNNLTPMTRCVDAKANKNESKKKLNL